MGTKSAWTPERRAEQKERIQQTKPWLKSTGPRTSEGKAVSSQNARMSPERAAELQMMADQRDFLLMMYGRQRLPKTPKPEWMRKG